MSMIFKRWLKEPLLQFLLVGGMIFGLYHHVHPTVDQASRGHEIVLTKNDLLQIALQWLAQGRPVPTADQMRALIEQKIGEEVLSREAVALGLDKDDEIIKRRLAQKM